MISKIHSSLPLICLLGFVFVISSCEVTRYYMPAEVNVPGDYDKGKVIQENLYRYFILRQQNQFYGMTKVRIDSTTLSLNAIITRVAPEHYHYIMAKKDKFRPSTPETENEIHVYSSDTTEYTYGQMIEIPLSHIEKIELLEFDSVKTKKIHTYETIGGALIVGLVAAGLIGAYLTAHPFFSW